MKPHGNEAFPWFRFLLWSEVNSPTAHLSLMTMSRTILKWSSWERKQGIIGKPLTHPKWSFLPIKVCKELYILSSETNLWSWKVNRNDRNLISDQELETPRKEIPIPCSSVVLTLWKESFQRFPPRWEAGVEKWHTISRWRIQSFGTDHIL